jgi:hypothetical protein
LAKEAARELAKERTAMGDRVVTIGDIPAARRMEEISDEMKESLRGLGRKTYWETIYPALEQPA